jgi:hypothetical protein
MQGISKTMLYHFGAFGEGALVSSGLGESYGMGSYLLDLVPGVNAFRAYGSFKEACF